MTRSGWCSGPPNARPKCGECVSLMCSCGCHAGQTCSACLAPVLSDRHHADCVAPLVVLCGESGSTEGESGSLVPSESVVVWDNGSTNKDGPRPAASTAGSSQGLADRHLRSVID